MEAPFAPEHALVCICTFRRRRNGGFVSFVSVHDGPFAALCLVLKTTVMLGSGSRSEYEIHC